MKKRLIIIVGLLIVLSLSWVYFFKDIKAHNENELSLYGNIDIRQVNLSFRVPGRISKMNFDEGNFVKAGEVVAELEATPYNDDLKISLADVESANANLLKMRNGSRKPEIESAKQVVEEKEASYRQAVDLYNRQKEVVGQGAVSKQALDDSQSLVKKAKASLNASREQLKLLKQGFRYEDIKYAKGQVELAKARVAAAETKLSDTKIVAPNDGIILTRVQETGAIVNVGSPVYTLSLVKPVWARVYVEEPDLGKVYPDMPVKVFTDSRPDKPYDGHIGFISPVAEFTPKNVQTTSLRTDLVFRLRVVIENPDDGLRQGMPVTAKILLNDKSEKKNG